MPLTPHKTFNTKFLIMLKGAQRYRSFCIGFVFQFALGMIIFHFVKEPKVYMKQLKAHVQSQVQSINIFSYDSPYNEELSNLMTSEVKVLCMVMTHLGNHKKRAIFVKNTWGQRCNKLLFLSSRLDDDLDIVVSPFAENRNALWNKTKYAFNYMYQNYFDEFDWFLKADDDS